jgi:hypothetical protein
MLVFDGGDVGVVVGCWLVLLWIVAARLWLNLVGVVVLGFDVEGCFEIWRLGLLRDVKEPPLSFQDLQPHVRSWWWVCYLLIFAANFFAA